jgi:hypothetical protein
MRPPTGTGVDARSALRRSPMKGYLSYMEEVESLARRALRAPSTTASDLGIIASLNGRAAAVLRAEVPLRTRRRYGAFFTGGDLSARSIAPLISTLAAGPRCLDPACGAGDLLLACAQHFPLGRDLDSTLRLWSDLLSGLDIHPEFIRAARARLILAASTRRRWRKPASARPDRLFHRVAIGDALQATGEYGQSNVIVVNPPFYATAAPTGCSWSSGLVSMAAVFSEHCAVNARAGTDMLAILPDVLRSGTRYRKWQRAMSARARIGQLRTFGRFDEWTDVNVFSVILSVGDATAGQSAEWQKAPSTSQGGGTVGDRFAVHVGPVVDYRDPHKGPASPYFDTNSLPRWGMVHNAPKLRRFAGRLLRPPFVAIRRNSRPDDPHRAVPTVVRGNSPVAVENHLLVLMPLDRSVRSCVALARRLRTSGTDAWLNQRIRCRHLTVGAVRDIPWRGRAQ